MYQTCGQNNFAHKNYNESSVIMKGGLVSNEEITNQSSNNITFVAKGSLENSMIRQASNNKAESVTESKKIITTKQESKLKDKQFVEVEASNKFKTQLNAKPLYKPFKAHEEAESREEAVFAKEFTLKPRVVVIPELEYKSVDTNVKAKQDAAKFVSSNLKKKSVGNNQIVTYDKNKSNESTTIKIRPLTENKVEKEGQEFLKQEQASLLEREMKDEKRKREELLTAEERSKVNRTEPLNTTKIKQDQGSHGFGSVRTGYVSNKKHSYSNRASSVEQTGNTDSPARKRRNVW